MSSNLTDNIKRFFSSAELVYDSGDYTSATILYFKTVFVVMDLLLLKFMGISPKDHTERFQMLKDNFPDLYEFLNGHFSIYQQTYSRVINKETCERIRQNVKQIIEKYKIEV